MNKHYISADQLLQDSVQLALKIAEGRWHPDLIIGIWRGGTPVAIAIQEVLDFVGIRTDHCAIRVSSYSGIGARSQVRVEALNHLERKLGNARKLLLVDDVYDTGLSLNQVVQELREACHHNPPDMRVATPYFKPANNLTPQEPDYYLYANNDWLVFPHELQGLSDAEIVQHKPGLQAQSQRLLDVRDKLLRRTADH